MKGMRFSQEKIVGILKEADCKTSTIGVPCRKHGILEQSFCFLLLNITAIPKLVI